MRRLRIWGVVAAFLVSCSSVRAAQSEGVEPQGITPVSEGEKQRLLAAETPAQKKLRAELASLKDSRIVFNANLNPERRNALFVMNPDGSELRKLSLDDTDDSYPHISYDGRRLAFQRKEKLSAGDLKSLPCDPAWPFTKDQRVSHRRPSSYIWVSDLDGSNARRLAQGSFPHWAPNGKVLSYVFTRFGRKHVAALLDMERNSEKAIVPPAWKMAQGYSAFSPDGRWLLHSYGNGRCPYVRLNESCTDRLPDSDWSPSPLRSNCNAEFSPDGRWIVYVADTFKFMGSWLLYAPFDPGNAKVRGQELKLGHEKKSVNYFPDFSPCGKYLVYAHGDFQEGVKSWLLESRQDLYVTRFPGCEATVRVTWTGAACQHPAWRRVAKQPGATASPSAP